MEKLYSLFVVHIGCYFGVTMLRLNKKKECSISTEPANTTKCLPEQDPAVNYRFDHATFANISPGMFLNYI